MAVPCSAQKCGMIRRQRKQLWTEEFSVIFQFKTDHHLGSNGVSCVDPYKARGVYEMIAIFLYCKIPRIDIDETSNRRETFASDRCLIDIDLGLLLVGALLISARPLTDVHISPGWQLWIFKVAVLPVGRDPEHWEFVCKTPRKEYHSRIMVIVKYFPWKRELCFFRIDCNY